MIDYFVQRYQGDAKKVYVIGFSNGGEMAYRLSIDLPRKITAIAPFFASLGKGESAKVAPPMPVAITNSTDDSLVKRGGGATVVNDDTLDNRLPVDSTINYWKARNNIAEAPLITDFPDNCTGDKSTVTKISYQGKYPLIVYKVNGAGNDIPFPAKKTPVVGKNCDYNSITEIWDFLLAQSKEEVL
jgi:polyhydroxybutyrate depolymerase